MCHRTTTLTVFTCAIILMPTTGFAGLTERVRIDLQQASPGFEQYLVRGWHTPDSGAAWTGKGKQDATIRFAPEPGYGYDILLFPQTLPRQKFEEPYSIEVLVNGRKIRTMTARQASALIEIIVPEWALGNGAVEVSVRTPLFCPKERGESSDDRWLGIKVQRVEILPWKKEAPDVTLRGRAVGIFADPGVPRKGAPSDPEFLANVLREADIPVRMLSAEELSSVSALHPRRVAVVVLPYGPAFPAAAQEAFQRFLRHGGSFIAMGGYAFDHLYGGEFEQQLLKNGRFDDGLSGWKAAQDADGVQMSFDPNVGREESGSARISVTEGTAVTWYSLTAELPGLEAGTNVAIETFVRAENVRNGAGAYAAISFRDADGERITWQDTPQVGGTSDWTKCEAEIEVPPGAAQATVSLLLHGHGTAWFDDVSVRRVPPPMNTRRGHPADFLEVQPDQISVFDAGYPLEHAVSMTAAFGQTVFPQGLAVNQQLSGMAAVGMTGANWYCTSPEKCRYVPLLETYDRFGRRRGPAGAMMMNYRGLYEGSIWAFFGIDNIDLFSPDHPEVTDGFVELVERLWDPMFLHETKSDLACYRAGEPVRISTNVSNYGVQGRSAMVQLRVRENQTGRIAFEKRVAIELDASETESTEATWRPGAFGDDLYQVEAVLLINGDEELDREDTNGFVVWDEEVLRGASDLSLRDNYFHIGERPIFMTGAQQFWASQAMLTSSPLTIGRDFSDMRDYGVRLARSFMMWQLRDDREERRFRDMMVYLAHKHGVVMYHEGTDQFPPKTDAMTGGKQRARFLAERYGDLPLFCVDHRNEPSLRLADSPRQNAWLREFARQKYDGEPPYEPVEVRNLENEWGDLRSYDIALMGAERLADWARELSEQMHDIEPELLTSVGFLQDDSHAAVIKDPLWASEGLDFMNRHFYGPLRRYPPQFKEIDMRYRGMPPSTGEFGSRTHPTGGGNFESKEQQFNRYLFISHYAFGLGGAFICNWHWRDPWESIFSYGIFRQDHVPKDIAKVYRAIGLLFGSMEPVYEPPEVYVLLPDYHRLSYYPLTRSLYRALNRLMDLRVDYGVIDERNLARLPDNCRAILFPLPYLPAEETMERLEAFVRDGGYLYVSGDLSYDAHDLKRSHPERLTELCGVESTQPVRRGLSDLGERNAQVRPTGLLPETARYRGWDRLELRLGTADAAAIDEDGAPVTVVNTLGEGTVVFTSDPIEADAESLADSRLYEAFLQLAGIERHRLTPDDPQLHCFEVGTRRGRAYILYNRHNAADHQPFHTGLPKLFGPEDVTNVRLPEASMELGLAPMKPGFAHVSEDGDLLAVETQGKVEHDGKPVIETDTHVILMSLDGRDIRDSRSLAAIALYPGMVRIHGISGDFTAELGELRKRRWHYLSGIDLERDDRTVSLSVDTDTALEIILLGRDLTEARDAIERLAGF